MNSAKFSFKNYLKFFLLLFFLTQACVDDRQELESPVNPNTTTNEQDLSQGQSAEKGISNQYTPETVYFPFDSDNLGPQEQEKLARLAESLKNNTKSLVIEGHCDERGTVEYNLALGERRANAVKRYLTQLGTSSTRISTISYGKERPVVEEHNESAWAQNRRAEFKVSQ